MAFRTTQVVVQLILVLIPLLMECTNAGLFQSDKVDDKENHKMKLQFREDGSPLYGVDVSFPMHHAKVSTNYDYLPHNVDPTAEIPRQYLDMPVQPLGNRQAIYDQFMESCKAAFGPTKGNRCISTESDRIAMTLRQPQSMTNYTEVGFKKLRAPPALWSIISDFWEKNKDNAKPEQWGIGNTYTNNWESSSSMVSVEDANLRGGGQRLKQNIWNEAKKIITEWTGEELTQCSLYGIRVYHSGSILAPHVDRLPLVSSAIINVAQDVNEPWPLEVIGHDGTATNVTMMPGDMVLYESHSVIHGRPYPLNGNFMANIFVHFEPVGHSLRHNAHEEDMKNKKDVHAKYADSLARGVGGHENDADRHGLPSYILLGSPEESHWRQAHPDGEKSDRTSFQTGSTTAHVAAKEGKIDELVEEIKKNKAVVNAKDENGWGPIHEAARSGHLEVVKLLVEHGADYNAQTGGGGGSVLWWAKYTHGEDHPVIDFLTEIGASMVGPEL